MRHRYVFMILCCVHTSLFFAQENSVRPDSIPNKKIEFNLDVVSRYLWRGQCWGGDYAAIQPSLVYSITPKISLGIWATSNLKKDYYYPDGETSYKGYQEIDFYATYQMADFLQLQLWDYYWPSVRKVVGVNNDFFNYGRDGVKTVDAILYFDFSEGYKYPFNATISTLVAGNDYRYDNNGENPKQNFTTYLEVGYSITLFKSTSNRLFKNIELAPVIGTVLNNRAGYYSYADYDNVSFINMGIKGTKEITLGQRFTMPLSINYIHNGSKSNTNVFGKNFLVATISFNY
jgi:hypothetical protein